MRERGEEKDVDARRGAQEERGRVVVRRQPRDVGSRNRGRQPRPAGPVADPLGQSNNFSVNNMDIQIINEYIKAVKDGNVDEVVRLTDRGRNKDLLLVRRSTRLR